MTHHHENHHQCKQAFKQIQNENRLLKIENQAIFAELLEIQQDCINLRKGLTGTLDALNHWKPRMKDPDGKDCSEAIINLIKTDIERIINEQNR